MSGGGASRCALGALVNAVTYSGNNDFEINVFGYVQPGAWAMDPAVAPVVEEQEPVTYDFGARLSGKPLAKNRLWYSVAANPRVDQMDKEIQDWRLFTEKTETVRFAGKLKWQASSKTNMELSVLGDPSVFNEVHQPFPGITTVLNPDILLHKNELGGVISSLRATVAPSQTFLLEMSLALQQDRHNEGPTTHWGQEHPQAYIDFIDGAVGGGVWGNGGKARSGSNQRDRQGHDPPARAHDGDGRGLRKS